MRTTPAALVLFALMLAAAPLCLAEPTPPTPPPSPSVPPFDAAYLEVDVPPADPVVAREGVDAYLQRQIATHAVKMTMRDVVAKVVDQKEVRATAWYRNVDTKAKNQNASTDASAMQALSAAIHVQRVPGTALFAVMVIDKKPADARLLTSSLIKVYLAKLQLEFEEASTIKRNVILSERDRLDKEVENLTDDIKKGEAETPKADMTNERATLVLDRKRIQALNDQLDEMRIAFSQSDEIGMKLIQEP